MTYETKVLLIALAKIVRKADNIKEIYEAIEEMANAEGVVLKPLEEEKDKCTGEKANAPSKGKDMPGFSGWETSFLSSQF